MRGGAIIYLVLPFSLFPVHFLSVTQTLFFFNSSPLFDSFFPTLPPPSHCHLRHCVFHLLPPPQLFIHAIRYSVSSSSFSLTVFLALIHMVPPASFSFLMYFSIQCRRLQKAQLVQVCTSKTPFLPQLQL